MAKPFIPYGRQLIDPEDIAAVNGALQSWLTTGSRVGEFELAFAELCEASEVVAVSSGTAALHAATRTLNIGVGDEVFGGR
jgi:dTDP-4-amino-4,6-dideoxygalactose transaminase